MPVGKSGKLMLFGLGALILILVYSGLNLYRVSRIPHAGRPLPAGSGPAANLAGHVAKLAGELGERNQDHPQALISAGDYIAREFQAMNYAPTFQNYETKSPPSKTRNVVATLTGSGGDKAPLLVIGAHYDTAPGTPGADDNASGVASLLELARRLRSQAGRVEIRFVAFSTEEPPHFGGTEMGSGVYARALAGEKREVLGMISLEMLGHYNDEKGSQSYPPLLSLFYPDSANFIAFVSNLSSRGFLKTLKSGYAAPNRTPVVAAALPQWITVITLSDHLNFWRQGWPAIMVTDTAFLRNPHYHQPTDKPEQLDYERMADVVAGLEKSIFAMTR